MKNKLKISEPCHENWNNMTPVKQGKHCEVCAKKVIDFTSHSRTEIIDFLDTAKGQTCGRFKEGQIDIYGNQDRTTNKTTIPFYKVAAASILTLLGVGTSTVVAQDGEYFEMGDIAYDPIEEIVTNNSKVTLQGRIKSINQIMENSKVSVYSGGKLVNSIRTNSDGKYKFEVEKGVLVNNQYTIKIFAVGFKSKTINNLEATKAEITMDISMEHEMMMMGEIIVQPEIIENQPAIIKQQKLENRIINVEECTEERTMEKIGVVKEDSIEKEIVVEPAKEQVEVTIYPNPSASQVFVRTNKNDTYEYVVTDLNGKLIFSGIKRGDSFELNFAGKSNGIYLISLHKDGVLLEAKRVVISH